MSSPSQFASILIPPGRTVRNYPLNDINATIPAGIQATFVDAMVVRKLVFVEEQGCRLSEEVDSDDEKSYHWVTYVSVGLPKSGSPTAEHPVAPRNEYEKRKSQGGSVPVATIRLVPPPHGHHPLPGSVDGNGGDAVQTVTGGDRKTSMHDGKELYIKIGRMATVPDFRGLGLGKMLLNRALNWAAGNPTTLGLVPSDAIERQVTIGKLGGDISSLEWKGLVLAHSQKSAVKFYEEAGFVVDEELGTWVEEGIEHVAMWKRLQV